MTPGGGAAHSGLRRSRRKSLCLCREPCTWGRTATASLPAPTPREAGRSDKRSPGLGREGVGRAARAAGRRDSAPGRGRQFRLWVQRLRLKNSKRRFGSLPLFGRGSRPTSAHPSVHLRPAPPPPARYRFFFCLSDFLRLRIISYSLSMPSVRPSPMMAQAGWTW